MTGVGILRKQDGYYFTKSCCPTQMDSWKLNDGCGSFRIEVGFCQTVNFQGFRVTASFQVEPPKQSNAS